MLKQIILCFESPMHCSHEQLAAWTSPFLHLWSIRWNLGSQEVFIAAPFFPEETFGNSKASKCLLWGLKETDQKWVLFLWGIGIAQACTSQAQRYPSILTRHGTQSLHERWGSFCHPCPCVALKRELAVHQSLLPDLGVLPTQEWVRPLLV